MRQIAVVLHDIRSSLNVGALLRTADGLAIEPVYISGYSPYPLVENDTRLPHIANKIAGRIHKTALGADKTVNWQHEVDVKKVIKTLRNDGYLIVALEQHPVAKLLPDYSPPNKIAIILGNEVKGVGEDVLALVDEVVEIPMLGKKESLNVASAAAIALYYCRFAPLTD
jgi:23S rRNA (guanosine2251-2'-O)-methyltransferase